jgi:cold shock CspA family protein/ribosome-associated translation inhibitor RaiA
MQSPLELINRTNTELPAALEAEVREKAARLERYYQPIMGCRVRVEGPDRHHRKGFFSVHLDIALVGAEITVSRQQSDDLVLAVRDAFDAARRQLEDHARHQRGDIKLHEEPPRGRVSKLFPEGDYGFLVTPDGQEIYFHRHSVAAPGFDGLSIGSEVRFALEQGEKGPQATAVFAKR